MQSSREKSWFEVSFWAKEDDFEKAQGSFFENGAMGLVIEDQKDLLIKAYFFIEPYLINKVLKDLNLDLNRLSFSVVVEQDWQENFRKTCKTFMIDPEIYIVPSFDIDLFKKEHPKEFYIEMDPENAFGTGHHQTTKLCLTEIFNVLKNSFKEKNNIQALDIGTGSGILSILISKLGVKNILATDNDSDAIITAKKNAIKNQTSINFLTVLDDHKYQENNFDLVVANILSGVLIEMSSNIKNCTNKGGIILLSGILLEQAESVKKAYIDKEVQFVKQKSMDEWCLLYFKKV